MIELQERMKSINDRSFIEINMVKVYMYILYGSLKIHILSLIVKGYKYVF